MDHSQWLGKINKHKKFNVFKIKLRKKELCCRCCFFLKGLYFINIAITFDRNYAVKVVTTVDKLAIMMIITR